jgi:iron complex transport system permease protein
MTGSSARRAALGLLIALAGAAVANLLVGPVQVPAGDVWRALASAVGLAEPGDPLARSVVLTIRLPRIVAAILAGMAAGITGAALQGTFRNPVADPHLLGVGPGAALGGALGSLTGSVQGAIAGGMVGGMFAALIVRRLGATRASEPSRFVLTGLALGAVIIAWVGFVVFAADRTRVPPIDFWLLGNLAASTWSTVATMVATCGVGAAALVLAGRTLDVLTLGESDARRLGVDVDMATFVILIGVGAVIGAAVGAVGVIAFIGLVVPHVVRKLIPGGHHRAILSLSAIGGAVMILLAELVARVVVSPQEVPVGLVTAAVGGPVFLWLIRKPDIPRP